MSNDKKKYTLAIETSSKICGVALSDGNKILSENNLDAGLTHSITLFSNIDKILKKNHVDVKMIDRIVVSAGPGSFTGIRIGIVAALGLAKGYNTKIEYIDTLDSLSYNVKDKADIIISMMDAKANRVFMSIYDGHTLKKYLNDSIYDIDVLISYLNIYFSSKKINFIFVGDGAKIYINKFKTDLCIKYNIAHKNDIMQKASSLIYTKGKISKSVNINYMLKSQAERNMINAKN